MNDRPRATSKKPQSKVTCSASMFELRNPLSPLIFTNSYNLIQFIL